MCEIFVRGEIEDQTHPGRHSWKVNLEMHAAAKCHGGGGVKQRVLLCNKSGKEQQVEMMLIVMSLDCQVVGVFLTLFA